MNCFLVVKTEKLCLRNTRTSFVQSSFTPQNVKAIYCSSLCYPRIMKLYTMVMEIYVIKRWNCWLLSQSNVLLQLYFFVYQNFTFCVNTGAKPLSLCSFQYDNGKLMMQKSLTGYCPNHFLLISIKLHFIFK